MSKSRMLAIVIGSAVAGVILGILALGFLQIIPLFPSPPELYFPTIVDTNVEWTESGDLVVSGRVVNTGGVTINPVILEIDIYYPNQTILTTVSTSTTPSILQPGQEAPFSKKITNYEFKGYEGEILYGVSSRLQ